MALVYGIGPFRLDPAAGVVTLEGETVALGARGVAVLSALVQRADKYVAKADILDVAWPGLVVEESNISVQIAAIRRVLATAPGGERWVETLARRGYRFVGPVVVHGDSSSQDAGRTVRSNLPTPVSLFFGRERELVEIKRLLIGSRLLTLVGVGGIGKTRIALQTAGEVMDAYRDGVWLADLAPLIDSALVPGVVAQVLGLREAAGTPLLKTLCDGVKNRQMLLLLDNCEHLLDGCAALADALLGSAGELSIIATSREPLRVAGEQTYALPPLCLPDPVANAQVMGRSEAVQLFVERARKQQANFALTPARAPAIAQLCIRLDGIPLALELAAARIRSLSVEQINARLDDRFGLLNSGMRTALPRQQTLRASLDWSYDLLLPTEKALLCRASVFAGGWTVEAAEQVCVGEGIDEDAVLGLIMSLANKSLVSTEDGNGATRYRLLETVRQYARDRLQESGEETRWRDRHLGFCLVMAETAESSLGIAQQQAWFERLEPEHDNVRSALSWSSAAGGDSASGLQLAAAIWRFWYVRGFLTEGRGWLSGLLANTLGESDTGLRAKALSGIGVLAWRQGDYPAATAFLDESLSIRRLLGDQRGIAISVNNLGNVARDQGDYSSARARYEEALTIRRELGDRQGVAMALGNLGTLACEQGDYSIGRALHEESLTIMREQGDRHGISASLNNLGELAYDQGDFLSARALYEESLAIKRKLGERWGIATSLNNLGNVASAVSDYEGAKALLDEAVVIRRALGDRQGIAASLHNLGMVACAQGNHRSALALHEESLSIRWDLGDRRGIAESLEGLALVATRMGKTGRAARLWAAAEQLRHEIGTPLQFKYRSGYELEVATARTSGGDTAFDLSWRDGSAMTLEQAVRYALVQTV